MDSLLIGHGFLFTLGDKNRLVPDGSVYIENGTIREVGSASELISKYPAATFIDARGGVILPGWICAHHHFYSALSRGTSVAGKPAKNFLQILKKFWWKLDQSLDAETIFYSALAAAVDCVKHGVTTVIDHHESQSYQSGSLDEIQKAVEKVGLRANLCLGVSDRYGKGQEGIQENERFLKKRSLSPSSLLTASVGLHASFTVKDATIEQCAALAKKHQVGVHTHCAEDRLDEIEAKKKHKKSVVERLDRFGVLGEKSLLVHCVHTNDKELRLILKTKTNVVHNPESNMNNAVGVADILKMVRKGVTVGLGTDGMSSEMVSQARAAYLLQRNFHNDPRVGFEESAKLLIRNNSRIVSKLFGRKVGVLEPEACADLIVMDYLPPTPLSEKNFLAHLLFGLPYARVNTVVVNGKIRLRDQKLVDLDESEILAKAREQAVQLWKRMLY